MINGFRKEAWVIRDSKEARTNLLRESLFQAHINQQRIDYIVPNSYTARKCIDVISTILHDKVWPIKFRIVVKEKTKCL